MLSVRELHSGYGSAEVLFGVTLEIGAGEMLALLGRNGMGKSTLIRSILGLTARTAGSISIAGKDVSGWPSHRVARAGIGWVPEGRQVFTDLTIEENLLVSSRRGTWTLERVYQLFPRLQERRSHYGNQISGGEQQMLAIGRALLTQPAVLILDEATEGLAPLIAREIWAVVRKIKDSGIATIVVDKNLTAVSAVADRIVVLVKGTVVFAGAHPDPGTLHRHLGI